jgi:hypothetical protein
MIELKMYADKDSLHIKQIRNNYTDRTPRTILLLSSIPDVICNGIQREEYEITHTCFVTGHGGDTHLRNLFIRLNSLGHYFDLITAVDVKTKICVYHIRHITFNPVALFDEFEEDLEEYLREV